MTDDRIASPVPVEIKNWAPPIKPPYVKNTSLKTYIVDPAGATTQPKFVAIAGYEPNRLRLAILVIDSAITLVNEPPTNSPDTSSTTQPNQGGFLPPNATLGIPYEFFGPDAFWINSLTTITRVVVIKEYS